MLTSEVRIFLVKKFWTFDLYISSPARNPLSLVPYIAFEDVHVLSGQLLALCDCRLRQGIQKWSLIELVSLCEWRPLYASGRLYN